MEPLLTKAALFLLAKNHGLRGKQLRNAVIYGLQGTQMVNKQKNTMPSSLFSRIWVSLPSPPKTAMEHEVGNFAGACLLWHPSFPGRLAITWCKTSKPWQAFTLFSNLAIISRMLNPRENMAELVVIVCCSQISCHTPNWECHESFIMFELLWYHDVNIHLYLSLLIYNSPDN